MGGSFAMESVADLAWNTHDAWVGGFDPFRTYKMTEVTVRCDLSHPGND